MRILLVRPRPHRETIGLQSLMVCEPLELMLLSAVLKANGHQVTLLDKILDALPLRRAVARLKPDLVCLTGYISHIGVIKDYAKTIKQADSGIKVAVGGVHAAVCPEDFAHPAIDLVCRTADQLYDYLGCLDKTERLPDRNIAARYADRYYYLFQDKCALIKTSFGCPYNCSFCFCKEVTPYRARPVDDVVEELLTIPQKEVYIVDDDFLFNRNRLLEFYQKVRQQGIRKNYLAYGRADFIADNRDIVVLLREIGLTAVIVGIEAAGQNELDAWGKRLSVDHNVRAVRVLRELGIECYATVILGPDWKTQDFNRLFRFIQENRLVFVNLQPFTPMPGTSYFEQYRDRLLVPYSQPEKWDMAHLVVRPGGMSVRSYYWHILSLYCKITLHPRSFCYIVRRYGLGATLKLSVGAARITGQYLQKIIRG